MKSIKGLRHIRAIVFEFVEVQISGGRLPFICPFYDVFLLKGQINQVFIKDLYLVYVTLDRHRKHILAFSRFGYFVQAFAQRCLNFDFVCFIRMCRNTNFLEDGENFLLDKQLLSEGIVVGKHRQKFQSLQNYSFLFRREALPDDHDNLTVHHGCNNETNIAVNSWLFTQRSCQPKYILNHKIITPVVFGNGEDLLEE